MNNYYDKKADRIAWDNAQVKVRPKIDPKFLMVLLYRCNIYTSFSGNQKCNVLFSSLNVVESMGQKTGPKSRDLTAAATKSTEPELNHLKIFIASKPSQEMTF